MRILRQFLGFLLNIIFLPNTVLAKIIGVVFTNWLATLIHFVLLFFISLPFILWLALMTDIFVGTELLVKGISSEVSATLSVVRDLYFIWGTVRAHKFFKQKRIDNQKCKCSRCQSKNIEPRLLTHGRGS